jgi:hypothetical protein
MAQSGSVLLALRRAARRIRPITFKTAVGLGNPRLLEAGTLATIEIAMTAER